MRTTRSDMVMFVIGALALLVAVKSMAATTAVLQLRGTVPARVSVEITPEAIALNLPITTTQNNTKVATVTTRSNVPAGYSLSFSSANQGALKRVGGTESIPYTISFDGAPIALTGTTTISYGFTNAAPLNRDMNISYTGISEEDYVAGTYEDSITVTITAN